jgi:hypothetical protein
LLSECKVGNLSSFGKVNIALDFDVLSGDLLAEEIDYDRNYLVCILLFFQIYYINI